MIDLLANQRLIYYAEQISVEDLFDEDGYETGENAPEYSEPKPLWINLSAATGRAEYIAFGHFTEYTRTLITSDTTCPLKEFDVVWVKADISEQPDYKVVRKAEGLDSIMYAIQEIAS